MRRETPLLPVIFNWTDLILNISINNNNINNNNLYNVPHVIDPAGSGFKGQNSDLNDQGSSGLDLSSPSGSSEEDWGSCRDWQEAQHTLFQLANLCAAISLLTPSSFRHHLLFLRCLLLVAFLFFILWAGLFVCMLDVLIWNSVFFLIDLIHIVCLAYKNIPSRFNPSLKEVYAKKFQPLKVTGHEFSRLCAIARVLPLRQGSQYAVEDVTPCGEKISILVSGRLKVNHSTVFLHHVEANEFVDSLEFDSIPFHVETNEKFQVTMTAVEDCALLTWQYPSLRAFLASNPFVWIVFTSLIGKDISDKLYRIQEHLLKESEAAASAHSTPGPTPCHTPHLHSSRFELASRSTSLTRQLSSSPGHASGRTQFPSAFLNQCSGAYTPSSPQGRRFFDKHYYC